MTGTKVASEGFSSEIIQKVPRITILYKLKKLAIFIRKLA